MTFYLNNKKKSDIQGNIMVVKLYKIRELKNYHKR